MFTLDQYKQCVALLPGRLGEQFRVTVSPDRASVEISFPHSDRNETELQRVCFDTGFYKYVTNEASDYGVASGERSYLYVLNDTYREWPEFEEAHRKFIAFSTD